MVGGAIRLVLGKGLRLLPYGRWGDFLYTLAYFVYAQRRLPRRNSGLFNDYMFFLRNSAEMADALRQITSDKVYAKLFIDQIVGRRVTPETYAVFDSVEQIRRGELPERCVLKPAHGTGGVVFLEHGDAEISPAEYDGLRRALASDLYRENREVNYKHLRRRIICEQLMAGAAEVKDYKLFYREGRLKFIQVDSGRHDDHRQNFYDSAWNRIEVVYNNNPTGEWEPVPPTFGEMSAIAEKLAQHFTSARIDFYLGDGAVFVGEITHCHNNANGIFATIEQERAISRVFFG